MSVGVLLKANTFIINASIKLTNAYAKSNFASIKLTNAYAKSIFA
jgi:hypothetical protein